MDCLRVEENLWEYHRDRLPAGFKAEISLHLQVCRKCSDNLASLQQVDLELEQYGEISPSPSFDQKLMARLNAAEKPSRWFGLLILFRQHQRFAGVFAVLVLAVTSLWIVVRYQVRLESDSDRRVVGLQKKPAGDGLPAPALPDSELTRKTPVPQQAQEQEGTNSILEEEGIPAEDRKLVENLDLLENYELLNRIDLEDEQANGQLAVETD